MQKAGSEAFRIVGSSHVSGFYDFFNSHGVAGFSIHGGGYDEARELISRGTLDLNEPPTCLFVWTGGNDAARLDITVDIVIGKLSELLRTIHRRWPDCLVVTGSIVPRIFDDDRTTASFLTDIIHIDDTLVKHFPNHKHWCTDISIGDNARPRRSFFKRDMTHLSPIGTAMYQSLWDWILGCVNTDTYNENVRIGPLSDSRFGFWRF